MLFGVSFLVFCIACSVLYYSNVSFSRLITLVEERAGFSYYGLHIILLFLLIGFSSFSGGLSQAALFYSGNHWDFHITINFL